MMHYFKVLPTSPVWAEMGTVATQEKLRKKALRRFVKDFGLSLDTRFRVSGGQVIGPELKFAPEGRPGWVWRVKPQRYVPDTKTECGKQLAERLKQIPTVATSDQLSERVFGHDLVFGREGGGMCTRHASFSWSKWGRIVSMHTDVKKAAKTWPDGLVEVTASEAERILEGPAPAKKALKSKKGKG